MIDIDREDRIDQYLRGEMTPEERADFEKEMVKDKQLAEDVETTRLLIERMRALEEKKRLMAQWEVNFQNSKEKIDEMEEKEENNKAKTVKMNRWPLILSAAACVVGGLFLWHSLSPTDTGEPAARGGSALKYINSLIDDGKYDEAIGLIDAALADTTVDTTLPAKVQEQLRKEKQDELDSLLQLKEKVIKSRGNIPDGSPSDSNSPE